jgi:hypothetical protein
MPALNNINTWRSPYRSRGYLYFHQPAVIFQARVNQATFAYPLAALDYDSPTGEYTDIREGMTITLGSVPLGRDLGVQRIRKAPPHPPCIWVGRVRAHPMRVRFVPPMMPISPFGMSIACGRGCPVSSVMAPTSRILIYPQGPIPANPHPSPMGVVPK